MIAAWLQRAREVRYGRAENAADVAVLRRGKIFILPTRNGFLLVLVLAAMLVGAINYGNSLAYALTFLLTSVAIVSILHTHRNLAGLALRGSPCKPVFAGEHAVFPLVLTGGNLPRFALMIEAGAVEPVIADVPALQAGRVEVRLPASRRGWLEVGRITVASSFPLGLFRAWSHIHLGQICLVYPRVEPGGPLPTAAMGDGIGESPTAPGNEEFSALRDYRAGDSPRHVHWKALAREQGLVTKTFAGAGSSDFCLAWDELSGIGTEARLSRLCRWVLWLDTRGQRYELKLPGTHIPPGSGDGHRQRCLRALALFGTKP